jgi:hypothetical protein
MKRLSAVIALAVCLPVAAQNVTATLQVQGDVRVSTGTDFIPAVDNQPVIVGQRILVGENAIAKVRYSQDCLRTYSDPGVYTVGPAVCRNKKDQKDNGQDQAQNGKSAAGGGGGSMLGTLGPILGTVIAAQQAIARQDESQPDRALSH